MRTLITILSICFFANAQAQTGEVFPMLIGQTLSGEVIDLPESVQEKYTIIGVAFSKNSQEQFESWVNPVYNKFIAKTGMMDDLYDVNAYFIALFTGAKKSAMDGVMKRMKAKSDENIFPYVLFYKGEIEMYKQKLKLDDKSKAYVFLLDSVGKIVYSTSGIYTKKKMLEIEKLIIED